MLTMAATIHRFGRRERINLNSVLNLLHRLNVPGDH